MHAALNFVKSCYCDQSSTANDRAQQVRNSTCYECCSVLQIRVRLRLLDIGSFGGSGLAPVCFCMGDMLCGAAELGLAILIAFCHVVSNIACNCTASLYLRYSFARIYKDSSHRYQPNFSVKFLQERAAQTLRKPFTAAGSTRSRKAVSTFHAGILSRACRLQ